MPEHKGGKGHKINRDLEKGKRYAAADTRIKNTPKCWCVNDKTINGKPCAHKRKVRDPKRTPHNERRTQKRDSGQVRSARVPKHVPNDRDDAYRNGLSPQANSIG